jgi:hypothetical protein
MIRIALWTLAALTVLIFAAFLWLRQSPYWAGITLFSENHRVGGDDPVPHGGCHSRAQRARPACPPVVVGGLDLVEPAALEQHAHHLLRGGPM